MKVQIRTRNISLEIIDIKEYEFREFCDLLSQKVCSCLYLVEDCLDPDSPIEFKDIRSSILDVAGEIRRLPINIVEDVI